MSPPTARGTVLGLDPGERRIGVALAPSGADLALPLTVLERAGDWLDQLVDLVEEHHATDLVVGLPLSLDGKERAAAEAARDFASQVGSRVGLPVHLVDERLSTASASRTLAAAGAGSRRRRGIVDRSAAAVILQAYLDSPALRR